MFAHQLADALTESPMPSMRGRRPGGSATGAASQLAAILGDLRIGGTGKRGVVWVRDKTGETVLNRHHAGSMRQDLFYAASIFGKIRSAVYSQGTPTTDAARAIHVIGDAIETAQKELGREKLRKAASLAKSGSVAATQLWSLGKAGTLWKVNESGEMPSFSELVLLDMEYDPWAVAFAE